MQTERKAFAVIIMFLTIAWAVAAQGQNENDEEKSSLFYSADGGTRVESVDGSIMKKLLGGVHAWHGDATLEANEGVYFSKPSEIRFYGQAVFKDSIRQLNADTLIYFEKTREAHAIGNVKVTEGGRLLLSDRVRYQKNIRYLDAAGGVTVLDDSTRSFIQGMEAAFDDSTGHGIISGKPFLRREEENGSIITVTCSDTLEILRDENIYRLWKNIVATRDNLTMTCSDTLDILQDENTIRLWKNVVVTQDSLTALSEQAVFNDSTETLILPGKPEIQYIVTGTREDVLSPLTTLSIVTGDTVRVKIHERKISGAEIIGSAISTTTSTDTTGTFYDRSIIESAVMRLAMEDDYISSISAEGTARSYYHRNYSEDENMFVNVATGDTLTFSFERGNITTMKIYGYGGGIGKGRYYDYEREEISAMSDSTVIVEDFQDFP